MADINLPRTQCAAKAAGVKQYFTGNPCPKGHIASRMTANYTCVVCLANAPRRREFVAAYKAKNRDRIREENRLWREANPTYFAEYHLKNQAACNAKAKAWREKNPGRNAEYLAAYRIENNDRVNAQVREWRKSNRDVTNFHSRKHCAAKLQAVPAWADFDKIREFYERAAQLTIECGIQYDVDHIVPLRGKNVCGLHVQYNLQVIPHIENIRKKNKHPELTSTSVGIT
jgi:hypothetical protein